MSNIVSVVHRRSGGDYIGDVTLYSDVHRLFVLSMHKGRYSLAWYVDKEPKLCHRLMRDYARELYVSHVLEAELSNGMVLRADEISAAKTSIPRKNIPVKKFRFVAGDATESGGDLTVFSYDIKDRQLAVESQIALPDVIAALFRGTRDITPVIYKNLKRELRKHLQMYPTLQ